MENKYIIAVFLGLCIAVCECVPKKYEAGANSNPFSTYSDNSDWRRSYKEVNDSVADSSNNDRTQRLGYSTGYGSGIQGYPNSGSGVGVYSPLKIDLGGVVIGTLVGIGALLILPKLINAFGGGGSSSYYRTADNDVSGVTEMLTKLDDFLGQNNIDSAACMQRAVCTYVRSSEYHTTMGTADQMEGLIHALSSNSLVDYIIDGTAIKEAVENGKNPTGRECDFLYPTCPLDRKSAMNLLNQFLPNKNNNHNLNNNNSNLNNNNNNVINNNNLRP